VWGLSPDAGGLAWASHHGRKEVATGGAASGCFSRRYGLDARGVEVSEGRDHVSLRVRRPVGFSRLIFAFQRGHPAREAFEQQREQSASGVRLFTVVPLNAVAAGQRGTHRQRRVPSYAVVITATNRRQRLASGMAGIILAAIPASLKEITPAARYPLRALAEDAITTDQRKAIPAYHRWAVLLSPSRRWFGPYYRDWLGPCVTSEAPAVFLNEINTCRNIKAMVSMAKQNGIQAILATLPPGAAQILKTRSSSGQTDRR
jgi:hypothetical protein